MATLDLREQTQPHTLQADMYAALLLIQTKIGSQGVGSGSQGPKNKERMDGYLAQLKPWPSEGLGATASLQWGHSSVSQGFYRPQQCRGMPGDSSYILDL